MSDNKDPDNDDQGNPPVIITRTKQIPPIFRKRRKKRK